MANSTNNKQTMTRNDNIGIVKIDCKNFMNTFICFNHLD